jgi:hypothetical protein
MKLIYVPSSRRGDPSQGGLFAHKQTCVHATPSMAPTASGPSPGALDWPMSTDPEVAAKLQLRASWSHIIPKLDDRVQLANKLRAAVLATEGAHDEVIADMVLRHVCCLPLLAHRFKSSASTQGAHRACAQLTWPCCSVAV